MRAIGLLCVFLTAGAAAQTTIQIPRDYKTIQAGINAANDGDTVLVSAGTYSENLDFMGKAITLTSGATSYSDPRVAATILVDTDVLVYGVRNAPIVSFVSLEGPKSVLNGFTIDASADNFYYKDATVLGPSASPTITNNHFYHSRAALFVGGGEVAGNWFSDVVDYVGETLAIGLDVNRDTPPAPANVHDNLFENNSEPFNVVEFCCGVFARNVIRNNTQNGIYVPGITTPVGVVDVDGFGYGVEGSVFVQNLIYGNQFDYILSVGGSATQGLGAIVAENTFANNTVSPTCKGSCSGAQIGLVKGKSYEGNVAMIANNIFATSLPGPYIICADDVEGPHPPEMQDTLQIDHNLFSASAQQLFDPSCRQQIVNTNLRADPLFVNSGGADFHLSAGSPAIDGGNNSVIAQVALFGYALTVDYDGNPRPVDATGRGYPVLDMGAYEFAGVEDGQPTGLLLIPSSYVPTVERTITITAKLSSSLGVPQGTIHLAEDGVQVASSSAQADGTAVFTFASLLYGEHEFIASYAGAGVYAPATSLKLVLPVLLFTTHLTLTATPTVVDLGQSVTLALNASSVDGTIPSPVTLTEGSTLLATLLPNPIGNASYASSAFAAGDHTITATYAGDGDHAASSATATFTVLANDFNIAVNPTTMTLGLGQRGAVAVLLTSLGSFSGRLTLAVGTVPVGMQSQLSPGSVTLNGGGNASAVLVLSNGAPLSAGMREGRDAGAVGAVLALLGCLPIGWRRRRVKPVLLMMLAAVVMAGASGCTGLAIAINPVAPGTYVIPVSGTDAQLETKTAVLTVVVP